MSEAMILRKMTPEERRAHKLGKSLKRVFLLIPFPLVMMTSNNGESFGGFVLLLLGGLIGLTVDFFEYKRTRSVVSFLIGNFVMLIITVALCELAMNDYTYYAWWSVGGASAVLAFGVLAFNADKIGAGKALVAGVALGAVAAAYLSIVVGISMIAASHVEGRQRANAVVGNVDTRPSWFSFKPKHNTQPVIIEQKPDDAGATGDLWK